MDKKELKQYRQLFADQHQHLATLFNELEECGDDFSEKAERFSALMDYSKQHFKDEESVMREVNYGRFNQHVAQHQQLLEEISKYCFGNCLSENSSLRDVCAFIKGWVANHRATEDDAFDQFVDEQLSN